MNDPVEQSYALNQLTWMSNLAEIKSLDDIALLRETVELECKLAQGRAGKGQLPEDFWPTYSAFANTRGGVVLLGIRDKQNSFELVGLSNPDSVRTELFNLLNNKQKISHNIIDDGSVETISVDGKSIIKIKIPVASRKVKPVFIGSNPMKGTYRRLNDGDRLCDDDTVRRMLAEQVEDTRDGRILINYGLADLDLRTLQTYRQSLRTARPDHPYLDQDDGEFLRSVGGWKRDRDSGSSGLTAAGLLMFGKDISIREEFPYYMLDYQERPLAKVEARWVDRFTIDGTWSGNLFDFYRLVYRKITSELKVPFALRDGQRQGETPVHEALREALVNTLVHADYASPASVLVVKRPDMFGFRNPGLMRIPIEQAIEGGESDGRNRILQQMFLLVGAGERAGSGVPKIYKGWKEQHWRAPALYQRETPSDQTLLELRMIDLLPAEAVQSLQKLLGARLDKLDVTQRLALATAATEGVVTHSRLNDICDLHPVDLTRLLQGLVQDGHLIQTGRRRGAVYHLAGTTPISPDIVFGSQPVRPGPLDEKAGSGPLGGDPEGLGGELGELGGEFGDQGGELTKRAATAPQGPSRGRIIEGLDRPIIDDIESIHVDIRRELRLVSFEVQLFHRVKPQILQAIIMRICKDHYLTLKTISDLVDRDEKYLRDRIINPLVEQGKILRAFPHRPNDPRQAYTTSPSEKGA